MMCWLRFVMFALCTLALAPPAMADDAEVAELVKQLSSENATTRAEAARQLVRAARSDDATIDQLARALEDKDATLRKEVAKTLASIGVRATAAVGPLAERLKDPDAAVRAYAAFALGEIGSAARPAAAELVKAALDKDDTVRRTVLDAMRKIKPDRRITIPLMVKALEDSDPEDVVPALLSLAESGAEAVPGLCEALKHKDGCYWACLVLGEIGPEAKAAVPHLLPVLDHDDPEVRMQAITTLGEIGPAAKPAASAIADKLEADKFENVKFAAAYALGKIGDKETALPALRKSLAAENEFLRVVSAWAVLQLDADDKQLIDKSVRTVLDGINSDDEHVRLAAARALAESDAPPELVAPTVIKVFRDADPRFIDQCLDTLASLGADATPRLLRGLRNKELRKYSVEVVSRIGPAAKATVPALIAALQDDSDDDLVFKQEVQFALGAIGPGAAAATDVLTQSLASDHEEVRNSAYFALGKIGPGAAKAVSALLKKLNGDDRFEQLGAAWALVQIRPEDPGVIAVALPILIGGLEDERDHIRAEAAGALGDIGQAARTGIPALERALDDESPVVRGAAAEALKRIVNPR